MTWNGPLEKIDEYKYRIPRSYRGMHGNLKMKTDGIIYADSKMIGQIKKDNAPEQVANVAALPGIIGYSMAMPDIHWGYGFPIGGVAATDAEEGVISPGGVGFDINCGVRLVRTNLRLEDVKGKLRELVDRLFQNVPSGVGSKGKVRLTRSEIDDVLELGAQWAVEHGYGWDEDPEYIEENGRLKSADASAVGEKPRSRGMPQLGSLGAGNHFLEVQVVDKIYDRDAAKTMGVEEEGQITVMIHTGSRGFGHQVCTDNLRDMERGMKKYGIDVPDRQLACVPVHSPEGERYLKAMACAANYAWANRQMIVHWVREAFSKVMGMSAEDMDMGIIYDVAHNIAKLEEHTWNGRKVRVYVHRTGVPPAFPPHHQLIPHKYKAIG